MSDGSDIVISGVGLCTAAGDSLASTWQALQDGFAIRDHARAVITCDAITAKRRMLHLAERVAVAAMNEARWTSVSGQTALVVGTSKGPADDWLPSPTSDKPSSAQCEDVTVIRKCEDVTISAILANSTILSDIASIGDIPIAADANYGVGSIAVELAARLDIGRAAMTVSAACASGLQALIRAAMMLQHGEADRAIVVGVESSLHPAFLASFERLGVLAKHGEPCRPFDVNRSGFLLSEAAAALCLERRRARPGETILDGYAIGGDASHLTSTGADGSVLKHCLTKVIAARPVDLIHAHATGTVANDPIELAAIRAAAAPGGPVIYSHKGALGHSLGASGLVAAALTMKCHRDWLVPGNVNTRTPLGEGAISQTAVRRPIRRSVTMSAGFGGATAVVGYTTR